MCHESPAVFLLILAWLVCGVANYGLLFAHFQRKYEILAEENYYSDFAFALFGFAIGPIGLAVTMISGFYNQGMKWQ